MNFKVRRPEKSEKETRKKKRASFGHRIEALTDEAYCCYLWEQDFLFLSITALYERILVVLLVDGVKNLVCGAAHGVVFR